MSTAQAIDPLEEAVRQRLAARRSPAADPLEQAVAARLRMRRESPDTFAPPVNTEPPMVGLPAQGSAPVDGVAMVDQQAADAHEQAAHDKALPWPVKAAGVVGGAVLGGAQRLEDGWRGFANAAADVATGRTPLDAAVLGGAPQTPPSDPAILPQVIASAAGVPAAGIPENIQRMQEVGAQTDPVTRFVGGLAAMPFDALTPEGIAALAITHAPAGALMRATYTRAALGAVADRLGPGVAKTTESALSGAAGLGGFSAVQTGLGGSTPEQAAESGLHGAAAGALFGLGGAAMGAGVGRFAKAVEARRAASDAQFREAGQVISDAKDAAPAGQYGVQRTVQMDSPGQVPQAFRDPPANSMEGVSPIRRPAQADASVVAPESPTAEFGRSAVMPPDVLPKPVEQVEHGNPPKPFTKAGLQERILDAYQSVPEDLRAPRRSEVESISNDTNIDYGDGGIFSFRGKIPTEVKDWAEGKPGAKFLFRGNVAKGVGEDAMVDLGETYFQRAAEVLGPKLGNAVDFLRKSPDPEHQFLAALHDNLPAGKTVGKLVKRPNELPTGSKFEINGESFEVVTETTDGQSYRVLKDGEDYPVVPIDSLSEIPVDKGSLHEPIQPTQRDLLGRPFTEPNTGSQRGLLDVAPDEKPSAVRPGDTAEDVKIRAKYDESATPTFEHPSTPPPVTPTPSKIEATDYDPTITGLRKSMTAAERKIMGLDGLDSPERRTNEQALKEAHNTGLMKPEKTQELIDAMNKEPWAASPAEKMAMLSHKVRLKNEALKLEGELATIKGEDPASVADGQFKLAELHRIEQEIDWTDHAYDAAGTASGRSLQAHAAAMNEAMDLVTVKARARAEKGTTLSPKETAEFQALHKQFEEVSRRATEAEAKLAEQQAETAIVRHKGGLRRKNPVVQKAEFDGLLKRARELLDMGCR